MIKKIILSLFIIGLILFAIDTYNSQKAIPCWWGVMYPTLSYVGFEDNEQNYEAQVSSTDPHYVAIVKEEDKPIKTKIAIIEWFSNLFRKEN